MGVRREEISPLYESLRHRISRKSGWRPTERATILTEFTLVDDGAGDFSELLACRAPDAPPDVVVSRGGLVFWKMDVGAPRRPRGK